ncbi:hypothetical protein IIA15_04610 [candidate division TA06 bacterium]|nr:hypothetical protein [candidate division TA06 bacterium]
MRCNLIMLLAIISITRFGCSTGQLPEDLSRPEWSLMLNVEENQVMVSLEIMDVFLVEDEKYPSSQSPS